MNPETIIKTISDLYTHAMRIGLEDARKKIKNVSDDLESMVENSIWMAYCEGIETAKEIGKVKIISKLDSVEVIE